MARNQDPLRRARAALTTVDAELDLDRVRSAAARAAAARPVTAVAGTPVGGTVTVEIVPPGRRPAATRRRTAVWALTATVLLLGGTGLGAALPWPEPGETLPGSPAPPTPGTGPTGRASSPPETPEPTGTAHPYECTPPPASPEPTPGPHVTAFPEPARTPTEAEPTVPEPTDPEPTDPRPAGNGSPPGDACQDSAPASGS
ncbi:hypothetical protein GCM10028784_04030 [Myceligenerans cantabricum]